MATTAKTRRISDQSMAVLGEIMDGRLNFEDIDTSEQELAFERFLVRMGRPNKRLHSAREYFGVTRGLAIARFNWSKRYWDHSAKPVFN